MLTSFNTIIIVTSKRVLTCVLQTTWSFLLVEMFSARVIMEALDEFKLASGLAQSVPNSKLFFCNVANQVKTSILHIMPFEAGILPIKYVGVPLISSRLYIGIVKFL